MNHLVNTQQLDSEKVQKIFDLATLLDGVRDESLKGKILATLFYEPSTRTRLSFESAMLHLGGNIITAENANEASSAAKGETIEDTIRVVAQYADAIVLRHPEVGSTERAAQVSHVPIINAGDGASQHPTQALLDLYTIWRELGRLENIHIALVGDLKYGRAARSLSYLLGRYEQVRFTFVSSQGLQMNDDIKTYLTKKKVVFAETDSLETAMLEADVVYQTRIQKERFPSVEEYTKFKDGFIIDRALADTMKPGAIIIHPLPRVGEIAAEVDDSPHAVYFKQVGYGLLVRMALLKMLLAE